jgi:hypothetical protein
MAIPAVYKKNVEITPLQERLLDYFQNDGLDLPVKIDSLEWILDSTIFDNPNPLNITERGKIYVLKEIIIIIKGIEQGY